MTEQFRFHELRNRLLAEAHARPSSPIEAPALASRIVCLSGEAGEEEDRNHMATLCERFAQPAPGAGARWCFLQAGAWWLRWERHTEASAWTVFKPGATTDVATFNANAVDALPRDWLAALPGRVLAAAHVAILPERPVEMPFAPNDLVAAQIADHPMCMFGDFRPGPDGFTRFILASRGGGETQVGRALQQLFEIESYRLLALLAFPLAQETAESLKQLESRVDAAANHVVNEGGVEADRALLRELAAMAGEAEALAGRTNFRFSAARAYYGLVDERIANWREGQIDGLPTIGEFMARRLAPAMRTCIATSERQSAVLERIARSVQVLSTRVQVASEAVNVALLASMDRRSRMQFRLQQTVESLSIVAVSYYALALLKLGFEGLAEIIHGLSSKAATALAAPFVVFGVWRVLRRVRAELGGDAKDG